MREALYYQRENDKILCLLCPQHCRLKEGQEGVCGVRRVEDGKLLALNYGRYGALAVDPIEKKPLYHFYPGWEILSLGTVGCNLHCSFCQNWELARGRRPVAMETITPAELLKFLQSCSHRQQLGVSYTYNEPFIWYEFVRDASEVMAGAGYKNVLVTNGMINAEPLAELLPFVHGMNVDIKAFSDGFYRRHCRGKGLQEVLGAVEQALPHCHVEVTYLIITTLNDSAAEIGKFIDWAASLDREMPVHFSRYFPAHRLDLPATPVETLRQAYERAREKLSYVYLGNVLDTERSSTFCPSCGNLLIKRDGYYITNAGLQGKSCTKCGYTIRLAGHIYGGGEV